MLNSKEQPNNLLVFNKSPWQQKTFNNNRSGLDDIYKESGTTQNHLQKSIEVLMKKPTLFLLIASLFIASPVMADIDGNKLLDNCTDAINYWENNNSLSVNFSSVNFCIGYISGANDLHKTFVSSVGCFDPPLYCKPSSDNIEQLVRTVVNFLKNHPEELHFQGSVLTMAALKEAFPCP